MTWRERLAYLHYKLGGSPSRHLLRTCWCQRGMKTLSEIIRDGIDEGFANGRRAMEAREVKEDD